MVRTLPVPDHPLLRIPELSAICGGDLHIGLEAEFSEKGVHVPSQTFRMLEEIISIRESEKRLILLGDIKHQVPFSSSQEYREIPAFLSKLTSAFESVEIVKGNHDGNIESFLPTCGVKIHPSTGFEQDGFGFIHGHTWPSEKVMSCSVLIMAHNHPAVMLEDNLGKTHTESCWLRCKFSDEAERRFKEVPDDLIVVPAMNPLLTGSPVNIEGKNLMGPLFAQGLVDMSEVEIYLLDGIYLGNLQDLIIHRSK